MTSELPDPAEDLLLVRRALAGERAAFDALYDSYFQRIYAFVRRRAPAAAQAEDWTQDVWVEVLRGLPSYRGEAPLGAWIFAIARRVVARRRKAEPPAAEPLERAACAAAADASPEARSAARGLLARVEGVLARSGARARRAFVLQLGEGLTSAQIARRTGASESAVKTSLARTRRRLSAWIAPDRQ